MGKSISFIRLTVFLLFNLFVFVSGEVSASETAIPSDGIIMLTGANRGIGLAVARQLKEEGYRLSLGVRNPAKVPGDLKDCDIHFYDAKDSESADAWAKHCKDRFGRVDAVIHAAGALKLWDFEKGDESTLDEMIDVNAKGTWRLAQATLPLLKETGHGRFLVFVSMSGERTVKHENYLPLIAYAASKHAQLAICKGIQLAGFKDGVRVCAICTSLVNTDMAVPIAGRIAGYVKKDEMTQAEDLALPVSTILALPNNAIVEELLVDFR